MKFNCGPKSVWLPLILGAIGLPLVAVFLLRSAPEGPTPKKPTVAPDVTVAAPPSVPKPPPPPRPGPVGLDPLLGRWRTSVQQRHQQGVVDAQSELLAREDEFRDAIVRLSKDDSDPRIRAFAVTLLGRMKSSPGEAFFVERLEDGHEYPRQSALAVLERIGTAACLSAVDRLAASDPVASVKAAAGQAAKAVRSR